jgi:two-component system LytT family sensor kinase
MTKHEFIFSDKRSHRIARHVVFWLVWCIAFNLLFHYPNHVFKGWDTSGPGTRNYQELGPVWFFVKTFFINTLFGVIVAQIAFTYVLIYWLLPNYYYKKRNYFISGIATMSVLLIFYFVAVAFKYSPSIYNDIMNTTPSGYPSLSSMMKVVVVDQLASLPIITGIALMIKLIKRWWNKMKETEQLAKEKAKAELQLLKSQVHPHFLFNTLNNIYYFTISGSAKAPEMIKKLTDLLNYILHECNQPLVPLEKEIRMIQDYMALEKIRYGDQMNMSVELPDNCKNKMIAPLLLIPFVENSFKHGTSKVLSGAFIKLTMRIKENTLYFSLTNNKPSVNESIKTKGNIGLVNVKKRLDLLYPGEHILIINEEPEIFTIDLQIQLNLSVVTDNDKEEIVSTTAYAIA